MNEKPTHCKACQIHLPPDAPGSLHLRTPDNQDIRFCGRCAQVVVEKAKEFGLELVEEIPRIITP